MLLSLFAYNSLIFDYYLKKSSTFAPDSKRRNNDKY